MLLTGQLVMAASPASAHHRFDQGAGWDKARTEPRQPVLVWAPAGLRIDLVKVIRPWNRLAGWKLFRITPERSRADVRFRRSDRTWVRCSPSYTEAFRRCVVFTATSSAHVLRHEIGHTLGLADHVRASAYPEGKQVNARVCDDPDHPAYRAYRGVMSYCDWDRETHWFGRADERMLRRAGY